jgi:hypothetical protein
MIDISLQSPIAMISSLLDTPIMVGYNRYCISLSQALDPLLDRRQVWIQLQSGIHPVLQSQLSGSITKPIQTGWFGISWDWLAIERQIRPALWHVLTDLPVH